MRGAKVRVFFESHKHKPLTFRIKPPSFKGSKMKKTALFLKMSGFFMNQGSIPDFQISMLGFHCSRISATLLTNLPPSAPSTTRWS